MKKIVFLIFLAAVLVSSVLAESDPFVGKWTLNVQKSQYPDGTCPRNMVIDMESVGDGISYRSDTTYANGATTHSQYTANYSGRQALVTGSHGMLLPVFLKRIDPHTVVASYIKSLQIVATSRRVVSPDGATMTITTTSKDAAGNSVTSVGVYEKIQELQRTSSFAR